MTHPSTARARRTGRVVALLAAASTATATLAGCSGVGGSAEAARVGDYVITDRQVQTATSELGHAEKATFQAPQPANVLSVMLLEPEVRSIARKAGVAASDDQARQMLSNFGLDDPSPATVRAIRTNIDMQSIGQDGITQALDRLSKRSDIEVSPRYGEIDPAQIGQGIQNNAPDWIDPVTAEAAAGHEGHDH